MLNATDASLAPRNLLLTLFQQGLAAVNGRRVVSAWLREHPLRGGVHLVALGKAADAMTAGALDAAGEQMLSGLVVTRYGHLDEPVFRDPRIVSLEAGHPVPDGQSLAAGNALLLFLQQAPADARFLFLISGGTSSVVEAPVPGVTLAELRDLNGWLLGSGLPVGDINCLRAALSRIKGGRLGRFLQGRHATVLLMSDVPGDVMADIGSGLLLPAAGRPLPAVPDRFAALPFQRDPMALAPNVDAHIVASNGAALDAIAAVAQGLGVTRHDSLPAVDAVACGQAMARHLLMAGAGIHLWGGETTVRLPSHPGHGGRNQQLALAAAQVLQGRDDILLLAAGSDGSDGVTADAGALVDGDTIGRGKDAGLAASECLVRADAGSFLEASGDLVHTGPTGTNVMDLIIGFKK
jgi:glycerate 2-kinase